MPDFIITIMVPVFIISIIVPKRIAFINYNSLIKQRLIIKQDNYIVIAKFVIIIITTTVKINWDN